MSVQSHLSSPISFVKNSIAFSTGDPYVGRMSRTASKRYTLKHPGQHSTEPSMWSDTYATRNKNGETQNKLCKFPARPSQIPIKFCALTYYNMLCKSLQQYSEYSFFGGILKTSGVTPFFAI